MRIVAFPMFVFTTVGVPILTLFLSFFHPQAHTRIDVSFRTRRVPREVIRPTQSAIPTRPMEDHVASATSTTMPTAFPPQQITPTPSKNYATSTAVPSLTYSSDEKKIYIMQAINQYRMSLGLNSVSTNDATCNFAKIRAQEIASNFSHDGFTQRIQNHTLPYSNYSLVTENIAETANYQEVVAMWKNSPGHAANMRANTPFVCVENYGNYYAYEGWNPQ